MHPENAIFRKSSDYFFNLPLNYDELFDMIILIKFSHHFVIRIRHRLHASTAEKLASES